WLVFDYVLVHGGFLYCLVLFFFSSRRRHTRLVSDWSSDVCSSDLMFLAEVEDLGNVRVRDPRRQVGLVEEHALVLGVAAELGQRSEERRVGKECRCRGAADH